MAVVHDYLNQRRGAERVALEIARLRAEAPIHTSLYRPGSTFPTIETLPERLAEHAQRFSREGVLAAVGRARAEKRHRRDDLCGATGRARRAMRRLPLRMQRLLRALHARGRRRAARLIGFGNRFLFGAILVPEADLTADVDLLHGGLGLVVHPLVTVGPRCRIQHHVTLATDTALASGARMVIGADVHIGAHAILLGPIEIGDRARIGAGTVITTNIAADAAVVGAPTRLLDRRPNDDSRGP